MPALPLLLATRNTHKTREFAEILGSEFAVSDLSKTNLRPIEETGRTFEENAKLKAVVASTHATGLVVADDSGLEVAALNGAPGVYSARYAGENGTDNENVAKLLRELESTGSQNRDARFVCVIALARSGKTLALFRGEVLGTIAPVPRGDGGFGYDPVFAPEGCSETFAQLSAAAKNVLSHRAHAIARLRDYLIGFVKE